MNKCLTCKQPILGGYCSQHDPSNTALRDEVKEIVTDIRFFKNGKQLKPDEIEYFADQILKLIQDNQELPDQLLRMNISGVAMPRAETDKISIQDLRLALNQQGEKTL